MDTGETSDDEQSMYCSINVGIILINGLKPKTLGH